MSLLDNLFGNRRASGFGGWNRGRNRWGQGRRRYGAGYGRGRAGGNPLARIALGSLAAFGLRKVLGNRRQYGY
ncbi:hypothetical protein [Comamonas sp. JC664]|uniref:hypothetical protein n=1 Tax=Comamonas sp. JC664 TaxID=2801917 RepID=UPI00174D649A|nr:hypothetical protein [Comamonas sp. JC664]MBL0698476.1 hypothetical protein [Comamonas sp. JC664]GHH00076.1 hypothetical protein GCM10012319_66800 [Comamonas sp. KCTC 72670]